MQKTNINPAVKLGLRGWCFSTLMFFYMTLNSIAQIYQSGDIENLPEKFTANGETHFTTTILLNKDGQNLPDYEAEIIYDPKVMIINLSRGKNGVEIGKNGSLSSVNVSVTGRIKISATHKEQKITENNLQTLIIHWTKVSRETPSLKVNIYSLKDRRQLAAVNSRSPNNHILLRSGINIFPKVNIISPDNNSKIQGVKDLHIHAAALDFDGTIKKVEFYQGNTLLGDDLSSPYSYHWKNIPQGSHKLIARVTDNQGDIGISDTVSIFIEGGNLYPVVSISSPLNGTVFTATDEITIKANALDPDGQITEVKFYNGRKLLGSDTSSPYSVIWQNVAAGSYRLTAKARDNKNAVKTSEEVNIIVNDPPTVTLTAPANNTVFIPGSNITITANASDSDGQITKVEFYNGKTLLGSDISRPYSFTWQNVVAGSYRLTAQAIDNRSAKVISSEVNIIVNDQPTVVLTAPTNNMVFSPGSNITLTAIASDPDGKVAEVSFYNGSTLLGTDTSSPYSFIWMNVAAGSYRLTAEAVDSRGTKTTSAEVNIIVNAPPIVTLTAPSNNTVFEPGSNITLTADASDPDGQITEVEFYNGDTRLGRDTSSPYSFTWQNVVPGNYHLTAEAIDNRGTKSTSTKINIIVNTPPTVTLTAPANNEVFTPGSNITLTANALDPDGQITEVKFYNGSTLLGTDASSPYSFTWQNVAVGNYRLTAQAVDNRGTKATSAEANIIVNDLPTVVLTAPVNNAIFTPGSNITLTANASDPGGRIAKVEFYNGNTLLGTDTSSPYSFIWVNVSSGSYRLTAQAVDSRGSRTTSTEVNIIVNAPPTVKLTTPTNNAVFAPGSNITISANASDPDGQITEVLFYNGSTLLGKDNSSPYSFIWQNVANGSYRLTARAVDNRGIKTTSAEVNIIVNAPPIVKLTTPANNAVFAPGSNITISANASDPDGQITEVLFYNGSILLGKDTSSPYSLTWQNVASGSYRLTARAVDNRGIKTTSAEVNIIVNALPTVTITAPANNAIFEPGSNIILSANASDPDGQITEVLFYNGSILLGKDTSSPYSLIWVNVASGSYRLTAKARDNQGMEKTSSPINIRVETNQLPIVEIVFPANGSLFSQGDNIIITANASDPDGSIRKVSFYQENTFLGEVNKSPYHFVWQNVTGGNYNLSAKAIDNKGAITSSAEVNIIVNIPPIVEITSPANGSVFTAGDLVDMVISASDPDGQIIKVISYDTSSAGVLQATDSIPPYIIGWGPSGIPPGSHRLGAVAIDDRGDSTTSMTVNVTAEPANNEILKLQYRFPQQDNNLKHAPLASKQITAGFTIVNLTPKSVPLHELTIRYWYTIDEERKQQFYCDRATIGRQYITGNFHKLDITSDKADCYLEVGFTDKAGILEPQKNTGHIEVGFHKVDNTTYKQENDYSFELTENKYIDHSKITLYRKGKLIWGDEPSGKSTFVNLNKLKVISSFKLNQNYPNPFNPKTTIFYQLPEKSRVILEIYNIAGHKICTLVNELQRKGEYKVIWNALDQSGKKVSSGFYVYRIQITGKHKHFRDSKKMLLIK